MDFVLGKYVTPRVFMMLGFSLSRLAARGRWVGKTFSGAISLTDANSLIMVELIKQSKRRNCEDGCIPAMMCIGKMAGCVVLPRFSRLTGKCRDGLC